MATDLVSLSSSSIISTAVGALSSLSLFAATLFFRNLNNTLKSMDEKIDLKLKNVIDSSKASDIVNKSISAHNKETIEAVSKDMADLVIECRAKDKDVREDIRNLTTKMDSDIRTVHGRVDTIQKNYVVHDDLREHKQEVFFALKTIKAI